MADVSWPIRRGRGFCFVSGLPDELADKMLKPWCSVGKLCQVTHYLITSLGYLKGSRFPICSEVRGISVSWANHATPSMILESCRMESTVSCYRQHWSYVGSVYGEIGWGCQSQLPIQLPSPNLPLFFVFFFWLYWGLNSGTHAC